MRSAQRSWAVVLVLLLGMSGEAVSQPPGRARNPLDRLDHGIRAIGHRISAMARAVGTASPFGFRLRSFSSDPDKEILKLINSNDELRHIEDEWERIWFEEPSSHLRPERVHGGIQ